jgi:Flp pilus assembly protein TadG
MEMPGHGKIGESLRWHWSRLCQSDASQLMEFAVALPLLVVLVVGIFDFGAAFNLKQELNNAVREGARFASTQPTNDLSLASPPSVDTIRFLVDSYLLASRINDCGLSALTEPGAGSGLVWTYTAKGNGCPSPYLTLTISRSVAVPTTSYGNPSTTYAIATQVSISYPFQWRFNRVIKLLVPTANYAGVSQINETAWATNMN